MINRHSGKCYRCLETVKPGEGMAHKNYGRWWTQHAKCHDTGQRVEDPDGPGQIIVQVPISCPDYLEARKSAAIAGYVNRAAMTGRRGQVARRALRKLGFGLDGRPIT